MRRAHNLPRLLFLLLNIFSIPENVPWFRDKITQPDAAPVDGY